MRLNNHGRKELIGHILAPLLVGGVFFAFAGRFDMYRSWIWFATLVLYYFGGAFFLLKKNPALFNERGGLNHKTNTKPWYCI